MELLQLRYFMDSAQQGSFAATAEKYMVPATSVSSAVKRLEKELGCRLFDRTSNRIVLNDNGRRMLHTLEHTFSLLDSTVNTLTAREDTREIRMLVRSMRSDITDHIVAFRTLHPEIRFRTVFDFTENREAEYDIIIDQQNAAHSGYRHFVLHRMQLRLKAAAHHPLCGKPISLQQLRDEDFISLGEQSNMTRILRSACRAAGFTPNIAVSSNDIKCYEKLVAAGIGIGLERQRSSVETEASTAYLNVTDFRQQYVVCAYYKPQAAYGNVEKFLQFLRQKASE